MKARVIREFFDVEADRVRKEGEAFEVTPERFNAINSTRWGLLIVESVKTKRKKADNADS